MRLKNGLIKIAKIENVTEVSEDELKKISNFETPNKVFAIVYKKDRTTNS